MVTHYDHNDPHHINMDGVLDMGDTDSKGHKHVLDAEYEQAQEEAFLAGNGGDYGSVGTTTQNGKVF